MTQPTQPDLEGLKAAAEVRRIVDRWANVGFLAHETYLKEIHAVLHGYPKPPPGGLEPVDPEAGSPADCARQMYTARIGELEKERDAWRAARDEYRALACKLEDRAQAAETALAGLRERVVALITAFDRAVSLSVDNGRKTWKWRGKHLSEAFDAARSLLTELTGGGEVKNNSSSRA